MIKSTSEIIDDREFIKTESYNEDGTRFQIREIGTDRVYMDGIAYDLKDFTRQYEELDELVESETVEITEEEISGDNEALLE